MLLGNQPKETRNSTNLGLRSAGGGVATVTPPKGGVLQGEGTEDVLINNTLQMVDRLELSNNTRAKVKQSIALNIADQGQEVVVGKAVQEMEAFRKFRNDTLNAFAATGQEPPPELLTRLDDLEKTTGQRISFQMLRKQDAAQLSGTFDGAELFRQELSTKSEIEDFIRPVATAKLQLDFQKDLLSTAQAGADLRKTQLENRAELRDQEAVEQFGQLDSLFPDANAKELESILTSGVAQQLGISRSVTGRWANERLKTYLGNEKSRAEIASKRATTSASLAKSKRDNLENQKKLMLSGLTTENLRGITQELTENSGAVTIGGVQITATDAASALDTRLKLGENVSEFNTELLRGVAAERENVARLSEYERANQWYTGDRNTAVTRNAEQARLTAIQDVTERFPAGAEREKQIALINSEFLENNKELIENAQEALEANATDYDKRLVREFIDKGSVSFTNDATDAIANNPGFANVIDRSSLFAAEADLWTEMTENADTGGVGLDGEASTLFDVTSSARDVKQFLDSTYLGASGETNGLTNRQMLRRHRHGSVQGVAAMKRLEFADDLNEKVVSVTQQTVFGGQNTSGAPVFTETGQISSAYRTGDGEFNFYKVMLEIHKNDTQNDALIVSPAVDTFYLNMIDRMSGRENGEQAFQEIKALTAPNDREEALLSSMTQGEFRDANGNVLNTMNVSQDVNIMIGRDFEENATIAYREYKKFISELGNQSSLIRTQASPSANPSNFTPALNDVKSSPDVQRTITLGIQQADLWTPNSVNDNGR